MERRAELAARVAELRSEGLIYREIAQRLGISTSYAGELVDDPSGQKVRRRKRRYDLVCVDCGGRVDGTAPGKMPNRDEPVCIKCAGEHYAVWTREAIIFAIQEWADEHGGIPPSAADWLRAHALSGPVPVVNHVLRRFGTWNAAIRAAGFEPHPTGPVGGYTVLTAAQREECARRYAAGESSTRIAADLGCNPNAVLKWVRHAGVPVRPAPFGRRAA
jgi:DNA-binding CsgD family transcriptional regulator